MDITKLVLVANVLFLLCNVFLLFPAYTTDLQDKKLEPLPTQLHISHKDIEALADALSAKQPVVVNVPVPSPCETRNITSPPRYVFIDLGANSADTLMVFLKETKTKFVYDYPKPPGHSYHDAEIFLFEANPVFTPTLIKAKEWALFERVPPVKNIEIFPNTAVWIADGTVTFYLDTVNPGVDYWGSSISKEAPDVQRSNFANITLESIDFPRWLAMNFLPRDYVVVKMDIERAEKEVVKRMVELNVYPVVDVLLVEVHPFAAAEYANILEDLEKLKKLGVQVPPYNTPAKK